MSAPDPESIGIVAKALIAVAGVVLALMGFTKVSNRAEMAKQALTDPCMTQAQVRNEILTCQVKVTDIIGDHFEKLRKELLAEIKTLHKRMTEHEKDCPK